MVVSSNRLKSSKDIVSLGNNIKTSFDSIYEGGNTIDLRE